MELEVWTTLLIAIAPAVSAVIAIISGCLAVVRKFKKLSEKANKETKEANKKLEIVEIQKKEEKAKLEVIQIQAEQKVAEAKAKEQQIKLSGAMSEEMKYRLDVEKETKIEVAKAIADGLSKVKLPETFIMGGVGEKNMNPMETFFNLMNVEKAKQMNHVQVAK